MDQMNGAPGLAPMAMPEGGGSGPNMAGPGPAGPLAPMAPQHDPMPGVEKLHDMASAMYDKITSHEKHQKNIVGELQGLSKLGDVIGVDDVIQAAGRLVSSGTHSPVEMAQILADMPEAGGSAMAQWVQAHLETAKAETDQLVMFRRKIQHELGVNALSMLHAHDLRSRNA